MDIQYGSIIQQHQKQDKQDIVTVTCNKTETLQWEGTDNMGIGWDNMREGKHGGQDGTPSTKSGHHVSLW